MGFAFWALSQILRRSTYQIIRLCLQAIVSMTGSRHSLASAVDSKPMGVKELILIACRKFGFYPQKLIGSKAFNSLIEKLQPIDNGFELIRIGPSGDGGYLVPDDLQSIDICFSAGVALNWGFEKELYEKAGIASCMFDASVNRPKDLPEVHTFVKKYVGSLSHNDYLSVSDVFSLYLSKYNEILAQIDIEGSEYELFNSISDRDLLKFRIIVCEFHELDRWIQENFYREKIMKIIDRLLTDFDLIHYHPNSGGGHFLYKGMRLPKTLELTFHRKNVSKGNYGYRLKPHKLDMDN